MRCSRRNVRQFALKAVCQELCSRWCIVRPSDLTHTGSGVPFNSRPPPPTAHRCLSRIVSGPPRMPPGSRTRWRTRINWRRFTGTVLRAALIVRVSWHDRHSHCLRIPGGGCCTEKCVEVATEVRVAKTGALGRRSSREASHPYIEERRGQRLGGVRCIRYFAKFEGALQGSRAPESIWV